LKARIGAPPVLRGFDQLSDTTLFPFTTAVGGPGIGSGTSAIIYKTKNKKSKK